MHTCASDIAVDALTALGKFAFEQGRTAEARERYLAALATATGDAALVALVEKQLGILADDQSDWTAARGHYLRALAAYDQAEDPRGCALTFFHLGRISAGEGAWEEAGRRYRLAHQLAQRTGDDHLQGLSLLGQAEVYLEFHELDAAQAAIDQAAAMFERSDICRRWMVA